MHRPAAPRVEGGGQPDQIREHHRVDGVPQHLAHRERDRAAGGGADRHAHGDHHRARPDGHRAPEARTEGTRGHDAEQPAPEGDREHHADRGLRQADAVQPDAAAHPPQRVLRQRPAQHRHGEHGPGAQVRQRQPGRWRGGRGVRAGPRRQPPGQREHEQGRRGDGRQRQRMAPAQPRQHEVERAGRRRGGQQREHRDPVRLPFTGYADGSDGRRGARAEPARHAAEDDQGYMAGGRGGGEAARDQQQPVSRQPRAADPVDPRGQREPRAGRAEQQRTAHRPGLGTAQTETGGEAADDGRHQVRGEVAGAEEGDERQQGARGRGPRRHGRSWVRDGRSTASRWGSRATVDGQERANHMYQATRRADKGVPPAQTHRCRIEIKRSREAHVPRCQARRPCGDPPGRRPAWPCATSHRGVRNGRELPPRAGSSTGTGRGRNAGSASGPDRGPPSRSGSSS